MKTVLQMRYTPLIIILVSTYLVNCGGDEGGSKYTETVRSLTSYSWTNPVVINTPDGDVSDQYEGFVLFFTQSPSSGFDGAFVISNGGYAFPEFSGKWKLNKEMTSIILDSGKSMNFSLNDRELTLDFVVVDPSGKSNGLSGHFTFRLQGI